MGLGGVGSELPFAMHFLHGLDVCLHSSHFLGFIFLQNLGYLVAKSSLSLLG